jgi:hypothetical protein
VNYAPMRKSELNQVEGTTKTKNNINRNRQKNNINRNRQKITLIEIVENDMSSKELTKSMTSNRIEWQK